MPTLGPSQTEHPRRVLVVDDEQMVRAVARLMLERAGFAVDEAGGAADALARVRAAPFGVILLDYTLPDRTGAELLPDLRRLAPDARVILTSGRPEDDLPAHGADGYLAKPYTKEHLVDAVRGMMPASRGTDD